MDRFLLRALIAAAGLWLADGLIDGLRFDSGAWLLLTALVLGLINAVVRPLAVLLTLPLTLVTLGLFLLVVNGLMLSLAAWLVPGAYLNGFWSAVLAALIVSLVSWAGSYIFGPRGRVTVTIERQGPP